MAKKKTTKGRGATSGLPVCIAMLLCDKVLPGNDGTISAIRIVDILRLPPEGRDHYKAGQALQISEITLLILVKNAGAKGKFDLNLSCTGPSGKVRSIGKAADVSFGGEPQGGVAISQPLRFMWDGEGVYWMELSTNNQTLARTPLRVKFDHPSPLAA